MPKTVKKWWKSISFITLLTVLYMTIDGYDRIKSLYFDYNLSTHSHDVQLFEDHSGIIDHRFDDGKLYLKYKTCHPPTETPEYYYIVWIDGEPVGERRPANGHYSINSWFQPIQCTEGWWGHTGFEGADLGSNVVVTWYWLLDDGSYQKTDMRYLIK